MAKQVLRSDKLHPPVGVFSPAVKVPAQGHIIYVSGLTARTPEGKTHAPGDVREQTRYILENLKTLLAEGGGTIDDVVRVVVYIRNMNDFKAIHEVRAQYFTKDPPASTMVEVSRLVNDDMLIEIEATAVVSA
jgi:2-iminobutanoate/2-iminopropanoate deaminase